MKVYKTNHLPAMWEVQIKKKRITVKYSRGVLTATEKGNLVFTKDLGTDESVLDTSEMKIWFEYLYNENH
jgi:hypothetical protein